jgi:hypothetical protein
MMIRVIDGKRYNTDKATCIFSYFNGKFRSDFSYRSKHLYRTANGAWFIHHVGGPMTDMATPVQGGRGWGEEIEPVSEDDAYGFLEAHSGDEEALKAIEEYFAERVQDA